MKIWGCSTQYRHSEVVPARDAPTRKKFGSRMTSLAVGVARSHPLPQAEGTHVGPDLLDVVEALVLRAGLAHVAPPCRDLAVRRPDRVLLLVIDDDAVDGVVLLFLCCCHPQTPCVPEHPPGDYQLCTMR